MFYPHTLLATRAVQAANAGGIGGNGRSPKSRLSRPETTALSAKAPQATFANEPTEPEGSLDRITSAHSSRACGEHQPKARQHDRDLLRRSGDRADRRYPDPHHAPAAQLYRGHLPH